MTHKNDPHTHTKITHTKITRRRTSWSSPICTTLLTLLTLITLITLLTVLTVLTLPTLRRLHGDGLPGLRQDARARLRLRAQGLIALLCPALVVFAALATCMCVALFVAFHYNG
jgi:uncharacterized metal-binding protein